MCTYDFSPFIVIETYLMAQNRINVLGAFEKNIFCWY